MSLPAAERGANDHLRPLWEGKDFDFVETCREHGRNNSFWVLCYRRHLAGLDLPRDRELRHLVKVANQATGMTDTAGEHERYTRHEAIETVKQVSRYRSKGLGPMVGRLRHWAKTSKSKQATHPARRLALAMAAVAERAGRERFTASTRQLGRMSGMSHVSVSRYMHVLVDAGLVVREGSCKPYGGYERGTSRFSIKPARPAQRIDEAEPPRYDALKARWTWRRPELRGEVTRWAWLRGCVPNVNTTSPTTSYVVSRGPFHVDQDASSTRGSPSTGLIYSSTMDAFNG